jgi:hypothetical protein
VGQWWHPCARMPQNGLHPYVNIRYATHKSTGHVQGDRPHLRTVRSPSHQPFTVLHPTTSPAIIIMGTDYGSPYPTVTSRRGCGTPPISGTSDAPRCVLPPSLRSKMKKNHHHVSNCVSVPTAKISNSAMASRAPSTPSLLMLSYTPCACKYSFSSSALLLITFFVFYLGYMGFAPDNLPDPDAMRLRACIHATPHMQARHPNGQHMHMHQHLGKPGNVHHAASLLAIQDERNLSRGGEQSTWWRACFMTGMAAADPLQSCSCFCQPIVTEQPRSRQHRDWMPLLC